MEKMNKILHGCPFEDCLTGHGHPRPFCPNRWDGRALLGQPSKGFLLFFHNVLLHYQHHISKYWRPSLPCYISALSHNVQRLEIFLALDEKRILCLSLYIVK